MKKLFFSSFLPPLAGEKSKEKEKNQRMMYMLYIHQRLEREIAPNRMTEPTNQRRPDFHIARPFGNPGIRLTSFSSQTFFFF